MLSVFLLGLSFMPERLCRQDGYKGIPVRVSVLSLLSDLSLSENLWHSERS